ncbi:MAG: Rps23 Pro-64 3,4-dihydroxylase Tpa1-like proline 4-hydroxylase [Saprospiraceae bacterium]|jgi:Rps23 Pro-64 3,4-dihydroxylase Tpa1-like proline 4-hydroxylase
MNYIPNTKPGISTILNIERWRKRLPDLIQSYQNDQPFPHISLDGFLENTAASNAMQAFPAVKDEGWIHYVHVNEKKHGLNKMELLPAYIQEVIKVMNSKESVAFISELTGIDNLVADETLEGGGLHQSQRKGYLNIHADFTVHPHKRHLRRRVNLLIYLNEAWEESYNGHLELWSRDMKKCVQKISPLFNRCVIFNTDEDSYHGLPEPILCPEDMTRKSIALYYFTEEANPIKRFTNYRARPGDGAKSVLIYLDKKLIAIYSTLKGWLGINDDFASKVLNFFNRKKRK